MLTHAKLVLTHISAIDNIVGYCCDVFTIYLSNASLKRDRISQDIYKKAKSMDLLIIDIVHGISTSIVSNQRREKDYTVASIF
jgi:hypothetical protein